MDVYKDFPLSEILYYRIGGKAKFVLKIQNKDDLLEALNFIQKEKVKRILLVGLGSNLLVSDDFFDGVVFWFSKGEGNSQIKLKSENLIEVFSSVLLDDLIQFSFKSNLIGLEWAGGLPSTVGGAIRGNAGAFGREIKNIVNIVEIVQLLNSSFVQKYFTNDQLQFEYRGSIIKQDKSLIVVSAEFKLQKTSKEEVEKAKKVYHDNIDYRKKNNPLEYPSCGSVFQNITEKDKVEVVLAKWPDIEDLVREKWHGKVATGYVIKRLGFSGFQVGGAEVSEKHANYILNKNHAKFSDVIAIIEKIKEKFYQELGFYPESEVEIVS